MILWNVKTKRWESFYSPARPQVRRKFPLHIITLALLVGALICTLCGYLSFEPSSFGVMP